MQRKYPKEMDDAIWAAMQDGMKPKQIQEAFLRDELGMGRPWEIKYRSLTDKMGKLRRRRGNPKTVVEPGKEVTVVDALDRQMLGIARGRIEEAEEKARKGEEFTLKELQVIDQLLKTTASIRKRIREAEAEEKKDKGMADLAKRSHESPRSDLIESIRRTEMEKLEARTRDDAGAGQPAPDAMNGSQEPDTPRPESDEPPDQETRPF